MGRRRKNNIFLAIIWWLWLPITLSSQAIVANTSNKIDTTKQNINMSVLKKLVTSVSTWKTCYLYNPQNDSIRWSPCHPSSQKDSVQIHYEIKEQGDTLVIFKYIRESKSIHGIQYFFVKKKILFTRFYLNNFDLACGKPFEENTYCYYLKFPYPCDYYYESFDKNGERLKRNRDCTFSCLHKQYEMIEDLEQGEDIKLNALDCK